MISKKGLSLRYILPLVVHADTVFRKFIFQVENLIPMKIDPHVAMSETGFIFHASTGDSFSVNTVGRKILSLIVEGKSRSAILASLKAAYEAAPEQIEEDLDDYLHYLRSLKILIDG